jgi:hypothetical protein
MFNPRDCDLAGPAITEAFLRDGLLDIVHPPQGPDPGWIALRGTLQIPKLAKAFGYDRPIRQDSTTTREGAEDSGWTFPGPNGQSLRVWLVPSNIDLDGPDGPGRACRYSPMRIAQRVLLATGERAGLLANGAVLRLLLSDPSRSDSHLSVDTAEWSQAAAPPDSFHLLKTLVGAGSLARLPLILDAARLHQAKVTTELKRQAREAIAGFINALPSRNVVQAATLWREGLILVYRLLFILKLESPAGEGVGFSFASAKLWRDSLSPTRALGPLVRRHLDQAHDTGQMLESGLKWLFSAFRDGLRCSELNIEPLGGALFGSDTTPLLDQLKWGERAVAILLDRLMWIPSSRGGRSRVHYGSLNVEDLGSIYEGLLEQEPGIATEPMTRLRRGKIEFVIPAAEQAPDIEAGDFFLRNGSGRKASGSFYTPQAFVRFLVRETLDPEIAVRSPVDDPHPDRLLSLTIIDPATGSGHFLVEACRYLGEALLDACKRCDELGLHDRIAALPDPDRTLAAYLPSRGYSEARARAICRRLVAVHCLYGCDRNKLAVELAKLSLWLESYAEGLPLTFLDHRLIHGDALTGPFFGSLTTLPVTGGPLDSLLAQGVAERLAIGLAKARDLVAELDASIGRDLADLAMKQAAKGSLDALLHPLRMLARAWTGAAMLRDRDSDDIWLELANHVADTGWWPPTLTARQHRLVEPDAIAWDLAFPEVFPKGFAVVLGNPPWDVVLPNTKDFISNFDPSILDPGSTAQRSKIEKSIMARSDVAAAFDAYRTVFERTKRIAKRLYRHQRVRAGGETTGGNLDLFRLFAERNMELAAADGSIGVLMPSAFHANEGTTGIRHLYLRQADLRWCLSFENRRRIFDIDSRFKFDLVVARKPGPTETLRCGFYLECIEDAANKDKIMNYDLAFLERTGGASLTPLELRDAGGLGVAETMFASPVRLGEWCVEHHIRFGNDLHMTADAGCFQAAGTAPLVLHEGKTIHQYTDSWGSAPRYSVAPEALKSAVAEAAGHSRLAFRDIARSNDERTMIACIAPPGSVFGHTATVEKAPWARDIMHSLVLCALFNSFPFDWLVRQKAATHLSLYLLNPLPIPDFTEKERKLLTSAALRLSCSRAGYDTPDRAAIDAVVAHAYGLGRGQYEHVLRDFSHRSNLDAPKLCLAAFDAIGPERR